MPDKNAINPGAIIELRSHLRRVDDIKEDILTATSLEGSPIERRRFFLPLEDVKNNFFH